MNVLIVDDDAVLVELLQFFLEDSGMTVVTAHNPSEALPHLRQQKIDLVLSDAVMPGGGFKRLLDEMEHIQPQVPVILMSGYGSADLNLPPQRTSGFWRKGENLDRLLTMVKTIL